MTNAPFLPTRRMVLGTLGGLGAGALLVACGDSSSSSSTVASASSSPSCNLAAETTEGPYYLDYELMRKNLVETKKGVPLTLRVKVLNSGNCTAIKNAAVDIWHCDATGIYSGYIATSTAANSGNGGAPNGAMPSGAPSGGPMPSGTAQPSGTARPSGAPSGMPSGGAPQGGGHTTKTDNQKFLRGVQLSDSSGVAEFTTIYPGWYTGRALHIHLKVHIGGSVANGKYAGGHVSHTGQLFFPEDVTDQVAKLSPYSTNKVTLLKQSGDTIFKNSGGANSIVTLTPVKSGSVAAGYVAEITVGVNPNSTPSAVGM